MYIANPYNDVTNLVEADLKEVRKHGYNDNIRHLIPGSVSNLTYEDEQGNIAPVISVETTWENGEYTARFIDNKLVIEVTSVTGASPQELVYNIQNDFNK